MSQQVKVIIGVVCLMVATVAGTAAAHNAMLPPATQAAGVTVGGIDLPQLFNLALTALGGSAGVWSLVSGLLSKVSPNLAELVKNPIANQFINQLPALLGIISAGKSAKGQLVFTETVGEVPVKVTIDVGGDTAVKTQ